MSNGAAAKTTEDFSQVHWNIRDKYVPVDVAGDTTTTHDVVEKRMNTQLKEDDDSPFYVINVGPIIKMYDDWIKMLPNVTPFYAVKCNSDPVLVKVLAELGAGFDCASKNEMDQVLGLRVSPERIIFANPCKMISHLKYAAEHGVKKMTADRESELYKVEKHFKDAELIVRIKPNSPNDCYELGAKYGCSAFQAVHLIEVAKRLKLKVIGVSFHVGSNGNSTDYQTSIKQSLTIFQESQRIGYNLSLLDIGGGFPGTSGSEKNFSTLSSNITQYLKEFVTAFPKTTVVSEPGRYFAASTHTLALMVHSTASLSDGTQVYHISDGCFGSFFIFQKHCQCPQPNILKTTDAASKQLLPSEVWGPTAAPDKVIATALPKLDIGDWLYFKDMGAYTREYCCSSFNGFPRPKCYYYIQAATLYSNCNRLSFLQ